MIEKNDKAQQNNHAIPRRSSHPQNNIHPPAPPTQNQN
jgi:hypothetical protein